jgi:hypothetical protein
VQKTYASGPKKPSLPVLQFSMANATAAAANVAAAAAAATAAVDFT